MKDKKFTYIKIVRFNNCKDCPHNYFHGTDDDCDHDRCEMLNKYIHCYLNSGDEDFRNECGVLDDCPFLKNKSITNEVTR